MDNVDITSRMSCQRPIEGAKSLALEERLKTFTLLCIWKFNDKLQNIKSAIGASGSRQQNKELTVSMMHI